MTTIFEALREDHEKQRTLLKLLVQTHGDSAGRRELFERAREELQAHADAEERHFYTHLFEHDLTQEKARHSIAEHHGIDAAIERLEATDMSSPAWLAAARKLHDCVVHHLDEEEHEVFQIAGKVLSDAQKSGLARDYRAQRANRD